MEVTIGHEALLSAVSVVSRVVAAKPTMPVLGGIFVRAVLPDCLYLTATDLDAGITLMTTAQVHAEGAVVLPGRMLSEAVRRIPPGDIHLTVDPANFMTTMTWGPRSSLQMHGTEPEQFPSLPEVRGDWRIQLRSEELRAMIRQTSFAASQNESRPILSGLLMEARQGKLWMVAVDFSRMALRTLILNEPAGTGQHQVVIPAKTLGEIARLLSADAETVQVAFSSSHAFFTLDRITVSSRLLEGQFPNYPQFIPKEDDVVATAIIDTETFLETCDRAALVCDELDRTVRFRFEDERMVVTATTPDVGTLMEELPVQLKGEHLDLAFNVKFVQDVLRNAATERVVLKLTGAESAAAIAMEGRDEFAYVLMPLKSTGGS